MSQNASKYLESSIIAILIIIIFYFRIYHATLGWFIHDSARDMRFAYAIATGKAYPCIGPTAGGVFYLGPFYYYMLSLPLFFVKNITGAHYFIAFLNALSVILNFIFVKRFFGRNTAIISSLLYASFPFSVITGRNMWNVALLPTFNILFFLSLFCWLNGKKYFLIVFLPLFSILTQLHAINLCFLVILVIAFFINKKGFCVRYFLIGLGLSIIPYLPYLYYEINHGFEDLRIFSTFLTTNYQEYPLQTLPGFFLNSLFLYPKIAKDFDIPSSLNLILWIENILWLLSLIFYIIKLAFRRINRYELILLAWFLIPFISILTKRGIIWFYYFDVLYPVQFILIASFILFLLSCLKNRPFSVFVFIFLATLVFGSLYSMFYIDTNLKKKGYYQIKLAGLQDIRHLNQGPQFIIPTFKTKLMVWKKIIKIYPFSYEQALTHIHGLGAWLIRDEDNRYVAYYFTQGLRRRDNTFSRPPELLIIINNSSYPYKELFQVGHFRVLKMEKDLPECKNRLPVHYIQPLLNLGYFQTPLFSWGQKEVEIECCCPPKETLVMELVLSNKNKDAKIDFFSQDKKVCAKKDIIYNLSLGKIVVFKTNHLPYPYFSMQIADDRPLSFDIDVYYLK